MYGGRSSGLFDRNFVVGHFLPVVAFVAMNLIIISGFELLSEEFLLSRSNIVMSAVATSIVAWLFGMFLFVANRGIVRFLEGYGRFNPARILCSRYIFFKTQIDRYRKLQEDISRVDGEYLSYLSKNEEFPQEIKNKRNALLLQKAKQFPDEERWLLPTAFGNTIRAFEVYPRIMYGIESIQGWPRLLAVVPEKYHEFLNEAKAKMDFWVNLWLLGLLMLLESIAVVVYTYELYMMTIPFGALFFSIIASYRARIAADEWGEWVKAAFDVYLPELDTRLGFCSEEKGPNGWRSFSQAIIYRLPSSMPTREQSKSSQCKPGILEVE